MLKMPVKILSDPDRVPFIPFVTIDSVFVNGTGFTAKDYFEDRYTKGEVDAIIESLGTVMDFKGVVETEAQLPKTGEPGDVYLVLHYEEGTITHGVIWQDGEGWTDMGTPIDLSMYYTIEETDELVSTSIKNSEEKQYELITKDIAKSLKDAKEYTDTSIYDLHIENYLTSNETKELVQSSQTIPIVQGDWEHKIYINELKPDAKDGEVFLRILDGWIATTRDDDPGSCGPISYGIYAIRVNNKAENDFSLFGYTNFSQEDLWTGCGQYVAERYRPNYIEGGTYDMPNTRGSFEINGGWKFNSGLKSTREPSDNDDVVNKKYLDEMVVNPLKKLIARLNGEDVSEWQ